MTTKAPLRKPRDTKEQRELRADLSEIFLAQRDAPACSKEARAVFKEMADTVGDIPREAMQLYLEGKKNSADAGTDDFSSAVEHTLKGVSNGTFKPINANHFVACVLVLVVDRLSAAMMPKIENGDQAALAEFAKSIVDNRANAFHTLRHAGLVIRQTQPDGSIRLQWPKPDHPAVAAFLASCARLQ